MNSFILCRELERDEGKRNKPYRDTTGHLSIGVGRNLDEVGLSDEEISMLLMNDIAFVLKELDEHLPWWRNMDEVRQRVIANMCFNLGIEGLLEFHNTLASMQAKDYRGAAVGMAKSKWAAQVGDRADRLIHMMRTGEAYEFND